MDPRKVLILGGLGNGTVIAAAIDDANARGDYQWRMAGYLNDRMAPGEDLEGHPVLGPLKSVPRFLGEGYFFINTIYRIDGQEQRISLFEEIGIPDSRLATFVHPLTYVASNVELGPGCVILPNVSISPGVKLGRCCLVMVGVTLGHNTSIGDHCHFAAQSCVGAYLKIGNGVHIGLNASVRENLVLGDCSTLAMGAVLLRDMGPFEIWAGVPARLLRMAGKD
jgi:sugar O-acyltransferase (sialic acid O-acetyltransferase NeuD family)